MKLYSEVNNMHKTDMDLRSVVLTYSNAGISLSELEIDNMISTLRRLILRSRQINSPSYEDLKITLIVDHKSIRDGFECN